MPHALRLLLGAATLALLASCGGGSVSPDAAEVRLVNASGEFGTLDLYESSDRLTSGVAPFSAGDYEALDDDTYTFSVRGGVAGATIATLEATLAKDARLTLVAYSNAGTPALAAVPEDEDRPDRGEARLRFFNTAAGDSGSVDAYLIAGSAACTGLATSTPIASAVSGLQTTFTTVNPSGGTPYRLCITAAGSRTDVRLDAELPVGDRAVVTVVLTRTPGAVLLNGAAVEQDGDVTQLANGFARVRLAVGVTAGAVTASYGSSSLGTSLSAPAVGAYRLVRAATAAADLALAWTGGTVAAPAETIVGGGDYTLLVADSGTAGVATATLRTDDNARSTDTARPVKIRLVNGAGTAADASLSVGSDFIGGVARGTSSAYLQTEASGAVATQIEVSAGGVRLCSGTATLSGTPTVYSVFVLGNLPASPLGACLLRADR